LLPLLFLSTFTNTAHSQTPRTADFSVQFVALHISSVRQGIYAHMILWGLFEGGSIRGLTVIFLPYNHPVSFTAICSILNVSSVFLRVCRMSGNCCALLELRILVVIAVVVAAAVAFLFPLNLAFEFVPICPL